MNEVEARIAIQELVARYGMCWDSMDVDGVLDCFTEDGVFVDAVGDEHRGRDEIAAFVRGSERQFGAMRHIASTHLVSFEGDGAASHRCYVVFVSHPGGERRLDTGEYEDSVVLEDTGWRFARRVVRFD
jgi:uncharacterized protein (TIGR02246 family)